MRPLIGIPPCLDERGRWRPGREYHYADAATARAVAESGGLPVYVPIQEDVEGLARRLDGLLLPGGDDLPPDRPYPAEVAFDLAPARQIAFDRALLAAVLERDRPVLGICYGMQLLALHAGGALHFDLPTDLPDAACHQLGHGDARHEIRVAPGNRLAASLGAGTLEVNSRHHQAVSEAGSCAVVARARADDLVEAVELPDARFALGVQWHPENLDRPHREALFGAFVRACAGMGDGAGGPGTGPG